MRKFFTMLSLLLYGGLFTLADTFTISELQHDGEYIYFSVGMEGTEGKDYTAFQIDIFLPEGINPSYDDGTLELYMDTESEVYPYTGNKQKTFKHQVSSAYDKSLRRIRVTCISFENALFSCNTGNLFDVYVLVDENQGAYNSPNLRMEAMKIITVTEGGTCKVPNFTKQILPDWEASVNLKISGDNKFSTCVLPFDAEVPEGVHIFSADTYTGNAVTLVEQNQFEAYTPYIIYASKGYEGTLSGMVSASKYKEVVTEGLLSGAVKLQEINSGYVMQNKGEGAKFYKVPSGGTFSIPQGKCWLSLSDVEATNFSFAYNLTGIGESKTSKIAKSSNFTLLGIKGLGSDLEQIIIKDNKTIKN